MLTVSERSHPLEVPATTAIRLRCCTAAGFATRTVYTLWQRNMMKHDNSKSHIQFDVVPCFFSPYKGVCIKI